MSGVRWPPLSVLSVVALVVSVLALVASLTIPRLLSSAVAELEPGGSAPIGTPAPASPAPSRSRAPSPSPSSSASASPVATPAPTEADFALQQLTSIATTDEASWVPDYRRDEFGDRWADVDGNGCDQRNDVLARDLQLVVLFTDGSCRVESGVLADPYTGVVVPFQHGEQTSQAVQIDHLIPLALAWRSGAWQWSGQERERFANDESLLLAVEGEINQSRSDSDLAEWLPPLPEARCGFVITVVDGFARYGLSMTAASHATASAVLANCGADIGIVPAA